MSTTGHHPLFPEFRALRDVWISDLPDEDYGTIEIEIERSDTDTAVPAQLLQRAREAVENIGDLLVASNRAILDTLSLGATIPPQAVANLQPIPANADAETVRRIVSQQMLVFFETTLKTADWWCDYIYISRDGVIALVWHDENSLNVEWRVFIENGKASHVIGRNV